MMRERMAAVTGVDEQAARWMDHITVLAGEIGPRGSTTPAERAAPEYCLNLYQQLGLPASLEPFMSAVSGYLPHLYVAMGILLAFVVYPLAGRYSAVAAAALAGVSLVSEWRELLFKPNPARWLLPKAPSQNAVAIMDPAGDHQQDLILMGHLDSNRTAWVFSSPLTVDFWRIVTPIIFLSFAVEVVAFAGGAVAGWSGAWTVSIFSAVCALLLAILIIEGQLSPYSPGANDNASGAALVLTLAEHLRREPLEHTRVWFVNTGCEEVKHYGAINFFERHRDDLVNPRVLVFEMLGRDDPGWLEREMIIPGFGYKADEEMVDLLKALIDSDPALTGHPTRVAGGHTEMADALRLGIPALTLIGIGPDGTPFGYAGPPLYWHQTDDTPDKMDPAVLRRAYALAWAFVRSLDTHAYVPAHDHPQAG